jgi:hypothetical protein
MTIFTEITEKQAYSSLFDNQPFNFAAWVQGTERVIEVIPVNRIAANTINSQVFQPVSNGGSWNIAVALGNGYLGPLAGNWFLQSGVSLTSGTITAGKYYFIAHFVAGDNFTNVGAGANATGTYFLATTTTPTTWTNGSSLQEATATLAYNATAAQIQTALNNTAFATGQRSYSPKTPSLLPSPPRARSRR